MRYGLNNTTKVILNIHLTYNCINIYVKYAIVLQFLKSVTLHVGVITEWMTLYIVLDG